MTKGKFSKTARELLEVEHDKKAQAARENQQILIYIFVSVVIIFSWILGCFQASFLWIFFLILLTFLVWWGKVLYLTEEHIKSKELQIHRQRALRQCETAEWVNFVLNRWWVFSSNTISDVIKRKLTTVLCDIKPSYLDSIEVLNFSLGEKTPYIKYVNVYEYADGGPGGKKPMSWSTVVQPPSGLVQAQQYQVVAEADVGLKGDDFCMTFRTRLGGKWMGMTTDITVEKLNISGKMQFVMHLDMDTPFPHITSVTVSFMEKPEVWFSVRILKSLQMMEIPGLKSWIHHLVMDGLTQAFVDPGKYDIKFNATGPTNIPETAHSRANAHGLLTVTLRGEESKGSVFVEDSRYCQLKLNGQRAHTRHMTTAGAWQDHCSFLIENPHTDKLRIKCKTKVLLSTYTLAQFEVPLADFPFEHRNICHTVLEEKNSKTGCPITLEIDLEYTVLPPIREIIERKNIAPPATEVAGVMHVCMHSAHNLLGLDRNGFSDPYCILYSNGKKIKTTHYINRTKNPKWDSTVEFTVADFTKTMLSFIVYDWDGSNASEDDFLGSAHTILNKDEPAIICETLTLGYNLTNIGHLDNKQLGSITVSVIFRSIATVAKSESNSITNTKHSSPSMSKARILSNTLEKEKLRKSRKSEKETTPRSSARKKLLSLSEKKSPDTMGLEDILAKGHGIMELHIIQARDLVAMDLNGFSDPYVDVKVNGERKFRTNVKKKTLDPIWNEFVTLQLPKTNEIVEIFVWDKDAFFSKDFLGSLSFTLDDLKRYSCDSEHDGWFPLHRIKKGEIQLKINVVLEEPVNPNLDGGSVDIPDSVIAENDAFPSPTNSESADSGVPCSNPTTPRDLIEKSNVVSQDTMSLQTPSTVKADNNSTSWEETSFDDPKPQFMNMYDISSESNSNFMDKTGSRNTLPMSVARRRTIPKSSSDPKLKDGLDKHNYADQNKNMSNTESHTKISEKRIKKIGRTTSLDPLILAGRKADVTSDSKYYGVQGQILNIKGLKGNTRNMYCKLRFDNHSPSARARKTGTGHVIAKSQSVTGWSDAFFGLDFEVDPGYGVLMESALTFDIKISRNTHLVTKTFTLKQILGDHNQVTKWLPLNDDLELEVMLHHANFPIAIGKKQSGPFQNNRIAKKLSRSSYNHC